MRTFNRTLLRTGVLQVDSVDVLQRAHDMPLFSRMGPYDTSLLERAASGRERRRLVEYWAHVQAFMPVELSLGEPEAGPGGLLRLRHLLELVEQLDRHRGADQALSLRHDPDRLGDLVDRGVLEQVAGRAVLDRVVEVDLLVAHRQHDDAGGGGDLLDGDARLDPGPLGHPDVHEDHVRDRAGRELRGGHAVPGLPHDLDVVLDPEQHGETAPEELLVVHDGHPDGFPARPRACLWSCHEVNHGTCGPDGDAITQTVAFRPPG